MAYILAMVEFGENESTSCPNGNVTTRRHAARNRTAKKNKSKETTTTTVVTATTTMTVGRAVAGKIFNLKKTLLLSVICVALVGVIAAFSLICVGKCYNAPFDTEEELPPSPSRLYRFKKAAVCTDGPPCSAIGRDILKKNGSAIDATIAAMFCNGLVNMQSMGLGGGFLMTFYKHDEKKAYTLNARETAPKAAKPYMFELNPMQARKGPLAVAVPGELNGYVTAHEKFGNLPWEQLVEPTIALCKNGFSMTEPLWTALSFNKDVMKDPLLKKWFFDPKTNQFRKGKIYPKVYCETLEKIAADGAKVFYEGEISEKLVEDIQRMGGIIEKRDLIYHYAKWDEPISVTLRNGDVIYSVRPPGSGALLAFMMNVLDGYKFTRKNIDSYEASSLTYHRIIETFKYAFAERSKLGDPDFDKTIIDDIEKLLSGNFAASIRREINDIRTFQEPNHYGSIYYSRGKTGTAHISVMTENGDAVSVTSSINLYFGAGITSEQTGIVLNSCMDDFSSPTFANFFGLPGSPANQIGQTKRPQSSMAPTIIVDKNGNVRLAIGASGGTKITTAIALVLVRYLWLGKDLKQAVDGPRFHHQLYPMHVEYEYGNLRQILDQLRGRGHVMYRYNDRGSVVCALAKENGTIVANADFRKGGDVYGLN